MKRIITISPVFVFLICLSFMLLLFSCGGGGGEGSGDAPAPAPAPGPAPAPVPAPVPAVIKLSASPLSVKSDNSDLSTITATVLDTNNAVISGSTVLFKTDHGQISAASADTDVNGEAKITFRSGTVDPSNQVATVTGTVSTLASMVPVRIVGSTLQMTHTTLTIPDNGATTDTLTITVLDASSNPVNGVPVEVEVVPGGTGTATLTPSSGMSDVTGKLIVTVTGTSAGSVTVGAKALNATATKNYTVIAAGTPIFEITNPTVDPYAMFTNDPPLAITVKAPAPTATVRFATSLGMLTNTALASGQVVDEPVDLITETATVTFTSAEAGLATIQVFDPADTNISATTRIALTAPATAAAFITVQSSAPVVARSETNVTNTATVKATVRTSAATGYQVVGNAPVIFSLENPTGGGEHISPVVVYTDGNGEAKTTFTSGQLSSLTPVIVTAQVIGQGSAGPLANVFTFNDNAAMPDTRDTITRTVGDFIADGFKADQKIRVKGSQLNDGTYIVDAVTAGTLTLKGGEGLAPEPATLAFAVTILAVSDSTPIIIGGTAGSVVIGVGTVIEGPTPTYYKLPMAVQVVDNNGQGVANATVSLHLWPSFYRTGGWYDEDPDPAGISHTTYISGTFPNEDINENLIMEPGEDVNGDGFLTPPSSAGGSIPATVVTDENGVATFDLAYLKTYGRWITNRITATTMVLGTECSSRRYVTLPVMNEDVDSGNLPATSPNAPYPLSFKIPAGGTTVPYTLPVFRGPVGGLDDTYTPTVGTVVGRVYSFTDPGIYTSGDVVQDTVLIQGWVQDSSGAIRAVYRSEPVHIYIE